MPRNAESQARDVQAIGGHARRTRGPNRRPRAGEAATGDSQGHLLRLPRSVAIWPAWRSRKAYVWAYARSWHNAVPGAIYEFCRGRGQRIETVAGVLGATAAENVYIGLNLFSYDTHMYLRQGLVAGVGTESFTIAAGSYGVTLTAFSEAASSAQFPVSNAAGGAIANLSLTVSSVPEPTAWALMLVGLGGFGTVHRSLRSGRNEGA